MMSGDDSQFPTGACVRSREDLVAHTFVELADTLVDGYDPVEFLHRLTESCVSLLGMTEAGVVLVDASGQLRALGSSSERMHLIELIELQSKDGPCLDCWRSGEAVREDHLADARARWPHFAPAALDAGFASVYAVPMRLRDERLGALNLFANEAQGLVESAETLAQALADVATIGILQERFIRERRKSQSNFRSRSTPGSSSSRPKGWSPRPRICTSTKPSQLCEVTPAITTTFSPTWRDMSSPGTSPSRL